MLQIVSNYTVSQFDNHRYKQNRPTRSGTTPTMKFFSKAKIFSVEKKDIGRGGTWAIPEGGWVVYTYQKTRERNFATSLSISGTAASPWFPCNLPISRKCVTTLYIRFLKQCRYCKVEVFACVPVRFLRRKFFHLRLNVLIMYIGKFNKILFWVSSFCVKPGWFEILFLIGRSWLVFTAMASSIERSFICKKRVFNIIILYV